MRDCAITLRLPTDSDVASGSLLLRSIFTLLHFLVFLAFLNARGFALFPLAEGIYILLNDFACSAAKRRLNSYFSQLFFLNLDPFGGGFFIPKKR